MKKSLLPVLFALTLSVFFISCESTSAISEALADLSSIAEDTGNVRMASYLNATSKATRAMEDITPEEEYYMGRAVAATVLSNYKVYNDKQAEQYINKICRAITINSENPNAYNGYHVKLLDTHEINAFATSSGIIFVTKGLYDSVETEDQLAAVVAHEVGHIILRHGTSAIKNSRWAEAGASTTNAVIVTLSPDETVKLANLMGNMVQDATSSLMTNGYSSNQEFDADAKALHLLAGAGYNPSALIEMLQILQVLNGRTKAGMFKTHPTPRTRINNAKYELGIVEIPEDTSEYRIQRFDF